MLPRIPDTGRLRTGCAQRCARMPAIPDPVWFARHDCQGRSGLSHGLGGVFTRVLRGAARVRDLISVRPEKSAVGDNWPRRSVAGPCAFITAVRADNIRGYRPIDVQVFVISVPSLRRSLSRTFRVHSMRVQRGASGVRACHRTAVRYPIHSVSIFCIQRTFRGDGLCDTPTVPVVPAAPCGPKGFASLRRHPPRRQRPTKSVR